MGTSQLEQMVVGLTEEVRGRFYGKYRGLVDDADDPEHMGRVRARVPSVYGDVVSPWALPAAPFAGESYGFLFVPKEDAGVWIEFEGGDPSLPIWSGCWWASNELPSPGGPTQRVLTTPNGLSVVMDDDARELKLVHPGGAEVALTDDGITLSFGSASIALTSSGVSVNDGALEVR